MIFSAFIFREVLTIFFLIIGLSFMFIGALGILRLPDVYHRLHASSKCATLGLLGLLLSASIHIGTVGSYVKSFLTLVFAFVALPVGSHVLAKSAHAVGAEQWDRTLSDELAEDKAYDGL